MGDFFNSIGTGIEDAFSSASDSIGGLFEPDKPFGSSVDPSKAEYDTDPGGTRTPENLEAIRLDAEYGDEGEPLNESAVKMEKLYDDWEAKEDSKSKWDSKKASGALSKLGIGSPQVIGKTGSLPGVDLTEARAKGYRPTDSLYAPPSYLQGSQSYDKLVNGLVKTLLDGSFQIRKPKIVSLV
tara:strand:+ start:41 stop:589 length:549 start_codon:yes stop_codon:yes gene_type:complete